ncbi:MAG: DUF72 domain-containing protein [Sphingomonadaceae bacterium]
MAEAIRIGCSGWSYKHWRGRFYPQKLAQMDWFGHYAGHFDTVELNTSFYRQPRPETFDTWREQAPQGFRYAVKANRYLTHMKKLKDCAGPLERMLEPMRRLKKTLGPILYQLPPNMKIDLERLESFLRLLPGDLTHVFEFREQSWHEEETFALLDRCGASLCAHDMPGSASGRRATGKAAYLRFHGADGKYRGRYGEDGLGEWADWLREQAKEKRKAWVYFNNDIDAHAIEDAQTLKEMLA